MKKLSSAVIVAVALLVSAIPGQAAPTLSAPVVLNPLWRVQVPKSGGVDYMTTPSSGERDAFPLDGAIFYVPKNNIAGTAPLYRLYNPGIVDHMESEVPGEAGYTTEGSVGYPWTSSGATAGLTQIQRAYKPATFDHITIKAGESLPSGYCCIEGFGRWGYARYNNSAESLLALSAGGVTIQSNAVAGGSLWRWFWNGTQFVNTSDYGREIQSALFWNGGFNDPTEAGDVYTGSQNPLPATKHGSPIVDFYNSGSTQVTRATPLIWSADNFGGGPDNPVLYTDIRLGKNITLNYNGMGPVAKYETRLYLPTPINDALLEIPTGYLRGSFNRYYTYDAVADSRVEVYPPRCTNQNISFVTNYGGVIISDSSQANAMGVFGVNTSIGGSVFDFTLWDFLCDPNGGNGEQDGNTSKWDAVFGPPRTIPAGWTTYTTWIVSGTLTQVQQKMRQVYCSLTCWSSSDFGLNLTEARNKGVTTRTWICNDCPGHIPDKARQNR